jgi:hypothetical protein
MQSRTWVWLVTKCQPLTFPLLDMSDINFVSFLSSIQLERTRFDQEVKGGFGVTTSAFDERQVRSRAVLRLVNDRVLEVVTALETEIEGRYLCECGREDCLAVVELAADEYEAIRSDGDQIVLASGH